MSNVPCFLPTNILFVNKQITQEFLPLFYAVPSFQCPCRIEQLGSQIGVTNFNYIRQLRVDADDLPAIAASLVSPSLTGLNTPAVEAKLSYTTIETLETEGYRAVSLTSSASRTDLLDALAICRTAQQILTSHPFLRVLLQDSVIWHGGADAVDSSYARVKWRFVRHDAEPRADEDALDLEGVVRMLEDLLRRREGEDAVLPTWKAGGEYVQYPYLEN